MVSLGAYLLILFSSYHDQLSSIAQTAIMDATADGKDAEEVIVTRDPIYFFVGSVVLKVTKQFLSFST
jgi:hypothetical protein